jgi:hypothetical protein
MDPRNIAFIVVHHCEEYYVLRLESIQRLNTEHNQ